MPSFFAQFLYLPCPCYVFVLAPAQLYFFFALFLELWIFSLYFQFTFLGSGRIPRTLYPPSVRVAVDSFSPPPLVSHWFFDHLVSLSYLLTSPRLLSFQRFFPLFFSNPAHALATRHDQALFLRFSFFSNRVLVPFFFFLPRNPSPQGKKTPFSNIPGFPHRRLASSSDSNHRNHGLILSTRSLFHASTQPPCAQPGHLPSFRYVTFPFLHNPP